MSVLPGPVRELVTELEARGFVVVHPAPEADDSQDVIVRLELSPGAPGGVVMILRHESEWWVTVLLGTTCWGIEYAVQAIEGITPRDDTPRLGLEEQCVNALEVLDRLHADEAVSARALDAIRRYRDPPPATGS